MFNFSYYSEKLNNYQNTNNSVVGKSKEETNGIPIKSFVGLKGKMYAYMTEDKRECKRAKGITKIAEEAKTIYEDYKNVLLDRVYTSQ